MNDILEKYQHQHKADLIKEELLSGTYVSWENVIDFGLLAELKARPEWTLQQWTQNWFRVGSPPHVEAMERAISEARQRLSSALAAQMKIAEQVSLRTQELLSLIEEYAGALSARVVDQ